MSLRLRNLKMCMYQNSSLTQIWPRNASPYTILKTLCLRTWFKVNIHLKIRPRYNYVSRPVSIWKNRRTYMLRAMFEDVMISGKLDSNELRTRRRTTRPHKSGFVVWSACIIDHCAVSNVWPGVYYTWSYYGEAITWCHDALTRLRSCVAPVRYGTGWWRINRKTV